MKDNKFSIDDYKNFFVKTDFNIDSSKNDYLKDDMKEYNNSILSMPLDELITLFKNNRVISSGDFSDLSELSDDEKKVIVLYCMFKAEGMLTLDETKSLFDSKSVSRIQQDLGRWEKPGSVNLIQLISNNRLCVIGNSSSMPISSEGMGLLFDEINIDELIEIAIRAIKRNIDADLIYPDSEYYVRSPKYLDELNDLLEIVEKVSSEDKKNRMV